MEAQVGVNASVACAMIQHTRLVDFEQLHLEDEVGVRGDDTTCAASSVSVVRGDLQHSLQDKVKTWSESDSLSVRIIDE